MLYLAYGSNLNKKQMSRRCPNATPVGSVILSGYKLEFRRVATIKHTKKTDDKLGCGLWEITEKCEKSLDIYEGFPHVYSKKIITLDDGREAMTYIMNNGEKCPPSFEYFNTIRQGFKDFGLPKELLFKREKNISAI